MATSPVSRLYSQVTADVRGLPARRWDSFRVADNPGTTPFNLMDTSAFIRWDEKAGLQRDAIRSQ
jgi:hypothetical protein